MTNIIAKLILTLVTNWTGVHHESGLELGYVATNHTAIIRYRGATNQFLLKQAVSDKAVWRKYNAPTMFIATNIVWRNLP